VSNCRPARGHALRLIWGDGLDEATPPPAASLYMLDAAFGPFHQSFSSVPHIVLHGVLGVVEISGHRDSRDERATAVSNPPSPARIC